MYNNFDPNSVSKILIQDYAKTIFFFLTFIIFSPCKVSAQVASPNVSGVSNRCSRKGPEQDVFHPAISSLRPGTVRTIQPSHLPGVREIH